MAVNTTSTAQSFTVTNSAVNGGSLKSLSISVVGSNPTNFPMTNTCGTTLAQGASCTVTVWFNPTSIANGFSASVQVQGGYSRMQGGADSGYTPTVTGVNFAVPLSGNGLGTVATRTSAATLAVPVAWYGQAAQTVTATYRNDGLFAVSLSSPALAAPLSVASNNCGGVAPGASCSIVISAASNVPGLGQSQSFTPSGANTAPAPTTVTWTTQTAVPRWSPSSLSFGQVGYGLSQSQNIILYNDGNTAYNWATSNTIWNQPTGYSFNTSACTSVAPGGGSCNVVVTFAPPGAATYSGSSISMSAASYNTNTFSVTGTGYFVPTISSSPSSVSATTTGGAAATAFVAFSNGSPTVTTLTLSVSGAGLSLSGTSLTCQAPGPCGGVTVSSPAAAGTYSGTITAVSSPPAVSPTTVPVTFTVNAAPANTTITASPTSLAFGTVAKGAVSAVKSVTVTNTGSAPAVLNLSLVSTAGNSGIGDYSTSGTCTSGGQLAAGGSCVVSERYTAACVAGARYVTLSIQGSNFTTVSVPMTATTGTATSPSCS